MQISTPSSDQFQHVLNSEGSEFGMSAEVDNGGFAAAWQNVFRRRASKRNLLLVFRQLSLLVETGIDIAEAIELVAGTCRQEVLRDSLEEIYDGINNGSSLSATIAAQKDILGDDVAASIQAGEASGKLVEVLRQVADQLEEELSIRSSITGAIAYPAILCSASVAVAGVLIWFVLPQFEQTFASMASEPPWMTLFLLDGAAFIRQNVLFVAAGIAVTLAAIVVAFMQPVVRRTFNNICFHSPVIGPALRNLAVGKLFMSIGHLLCNGISLLEAIQLVRRGTANAAIEELTGTWEKDVIEGRGLTHRIDEFDFLPDGADAMLIMAEKTGKLETVMATAGAYYRHEGTTKLKTFLKLSEPVIIIVLGSFVGTVVASVLLPIMDVQTAGQ